MDTARNYYPVSDILRTLDAMSWVKASASLMCHFVIAHKLNRSTPSTGISRTVRVFRLKLRSIPSLPSTAPTLRKKFTPRVMSNTSLRMLLQYVFSLHRSLLAAYGHLSERYRCDDGQYSLVDFANGAHCSTRKSTHPATLP